MAKRFVVGDKVIAPGGRVGTVAYVGSVGFAKGIHIGVKFINSVGDMNGIGPDNKKYFKCGDNCGMMAKQSKFRPNRKKGGASSLGAISSNEKQTRLIIEVEKKKAAKRQKSQKPKSPTAKAGLLSLRLDAPTHTTTTVALKGSKTPTPMRPTSPNRRIKAPSIRTGAATDDSNTTKSKKKGFLSLKISTKGSKPLSTASLKGSRTPAAPSNRRNKRGRKRTRTSGAPPKPKATILQPQSTRAGMSSPLSLSMLVKSEEEETVSLKAPADTLVRSKSQDSRNRKTRNKRAGKDRSRSLANKKEMILSDGEIDSVLNQIDSENSKIMRFNPGAKLAQLRESDIDLMLDEIDTEDSTSAPVSDGFPNVMTPPVAKMGKLDRSFSVQNDRKMKMKGSKSPRAAKSTAKGGKADKGKGKGGKPKHARSRTLTSREDTVKTSSRWPFCEKRNRGKPKCDVETETIIQYWYRIETGITDDVPTTVTRIVCLFWGTKICLDDFEIVQCYKKSLICNEFEARLLIDDRIVALRVYNKARLIKARRVKHSKAQRKVLEEITCLDELWRKMSGVEVKTTPSMRMAFQDYCHLYICTDYYTAGALSRHISSGRRLTEDEVKPIAFQLALHIGTCHDNNILWRGCSLDSILVDADASLSLSNFAHSKLFKHRYATTNTMLSSDCHYWAPEVVNEDEEHGLASDWWAFGCIIFELLWGKKAFGDGTDNSNDIFNHILLCDAAIPILEAGVDVYDFLSQLFEKEPTERLGYNSSMEVRSHPWLMEVDESALVSHGINLLPFLSKEELSNMRYKNLDKFVKNLLDRNQWKEMPARKGDPWENFDYDYVEGPADT